MTMMLTLAIFVMCLFAVLPLMRSEFSTGTTRWPRTSREKTLTTDTSLDGMELFAVVGTGGCAESLHYGPQIVTTSGSADGTFRSFLSTAMPYANVPSNQWLQIVTVDGEEELFRVYWTFSSSKTYTQRIIDAVDTGESVSYTIVDAGTGRVLNYSGTWRFSSGSDITARTFTKTTTSCCLSDNGGLWGGGTGTIDGYHNRRRNSNTHNNFWGLGNYRSSDASDCYVVFAESQDYVFSGKAPVAYMYHSLGDTPTALPTFAPTARPTFTPAPTLPAPTPVPTFTVTARPSTAVPTARPSTARPTASPTRSSQPTVTGQQMFATIGGDSCAKSLYFGPQAVRASGSADGQHASFVSTSTTYRDVAHTDWLQIVTSDGTTELFRIYWTFDTARTLADHFAAAASSSGAVVSYRVVTVDGVTAEDTFNWYFASSAFDATGVFNAKTTSCCFSNTATWGVGTARGGQGVAVPAWGQANPTGSDADTCGTVYMNKQAVPNLSQGRSYFYYAPDSQSSGGAKYALVQFKTTLIIQGISKAQYDADNSTFDNLFRKSIAWSLAGVSEHDISDISVSVYASAAVAAEAPLTSAVVPSTVASMAVNSIVVTCTVQVANSAYSYGQLAYALQVAVAGTTFNTQLHNYAAYLKIDAATTATAQSVTTSEIAASSDSGHKNERAGNVSTTVISVVVVFVVVLSLALWYYERCGVFKHIGRIDAGSTHSVDEQAPRRIASRRAIDASAPDTDEALEGTTARPAQRVSPRRGQRNGLNTVTERDYFSDGDHTDDGGSIEDGQGIGAVRARAVPALVTAEQVPYTIVRASRSQPRGAAEVPFAVASTAGRRTSSSNSSEIVQITPRSIQIARSTPRRSASAHSLSTPVAHALAVQPQSRAAPLSIPAAAVVVLPMEVEVSQGVVVAQVAPSRR